MAHESKSIMDMIETCLVSDRLARWHQLCQYARSDVNYHVCNPCEAYPRCQDAWFWVQLRWRHDEMVEKVCRMIAVDGSGIATTPWPPEGDEQ